MDLIIREIFGLLRQYKWELFLSVCLFSNLYPQLPQLLYYVAWAGVYYAAIKSDSFKAGKRAQLLMALLTLIVFTTFINSAVFDYRWIMMCILLYIALSKSSYLFYKFKKRFILFSLLLFAITGPLNWYAHLIGYNYQLLHGKHAGQLFTLDFSGFTCNPMWLSAACGIGIITLCYAISHLWDNRRKVFAVLLSPLFFISLQTLVWGGSRSAFGIALGASLLFIWLSSRRAGNAFLVLSVVVILGSIFVPIIMEDSEYMQHKRGGLELADSQGNTSRTALWNARVEEFKSSPLWGIGFGVTGIGEDARTGRAETGSGWLTVLSQTGLIGLLLVIMLVKCAYVPITMLRENKQMALFSSVLVFLCLHTMFEAYMFQSGWYLCLVLWLLVSILDDYKMYYEDEKEEVFEQEE